MAEFFKESGNISSNNNLTDSFNLIQKWNMYQDNWAILFHTLDKKTNMYLNKKLNRTERMSFAPIFNLKNVNKLIKNFKKNDLISGQNMTMCVEFTDLMKKMAPAAVHVDNTIRTQVLSKKYNNYV